MASFSQRKGLKPAQKALQMDVVDEELRNRLWSAIKLSVWDQWTGFVNDPGTIDGLPHVLWALCGKIIMISKEQSHGTTEVYTRVQDFCGAVGQ